jgi:hypothetical protein
VQVRHDEGVANRIDPESCADAREGIGEALTGEHIGQPLSRECTLILGADVVPVTEGNTDGRDNASAQTARRELLAHGGQFGESRNTPGAVEGISELVDVRAYLAEMAEEPRQLLALDRRAADSPWSRFSERERPQIGSNAKPGLRR